ncbi:D-2-hydroxyacid dehydrogenase [Alteromonas sediminis]|uniref:D-2-hydroxyacid dehydrogenase n=1 Tax=Alteromonas sediminis TaxID=2259342 RepID=A0A3N5Y614_9ALTE|nr:D-2-hydroxyacid dehydrogenase [Alteromonas sediminis]RPJ65769.1 D-2-hydroxyacid dehydrogenase [Alteromonas sediminis]
MQKIRTSICSRDASELVTLLADVPYIEVVQHAETANKIDTDSVEILLASPDLASQIVERCNNMKWLQSTWAGNAPLLKLSKRNYILTAVKNIFTAQMREYVFTYILHHFRKVEAMKSATDWQAVLPQYLANRTLGIMGAGSIAASLLPVAQAFSMKVIGLNRSGNEHPGYQSMYILEDKQTFAAHCDAIVNLLPDTPLTYHAIDGDFLSAMKPGGVLINAGRGEAIDEAALLHSLQHDKPALAVLDVFRQEPLPTTHPFWRHPKTIITHHTAAISDTTKVAECFIDNAKRYLNGEPLQYQLDFDQGY